MTLSAVVSTTIRRHTFRFDSFAIAVRGLVVTLPHFLYQPE